MLVGSDGVARVIDFGIAKARGRLQSTQQGELKGKLRYMAPEQLDGAPVSAATDLYAAGVVLWEALTSQRLFEADGEASLLAAVMRRSIPSLASIREVTPSGPSLEADARAVLKQLDEVIARATAREPATRFASAREMALALESCVTPASGGEVEAWVEQLAGDLLAERAAMVHGIESGRESGAPPASTGSATSSTSGTAVGNTASTDDTTHVDAPQVDPGPTRRRAATTFLGVGGARGRLSDRRRPADAPGARAPSAGSDEDVGGGAAER